MVIDGEVDVEPIDESRHKKYMVQLGNKIPFDKYEWRVLDLQNNAASIITENDGYIWWWWLRSPA